MSTATEGCPSAEGDGDRGHRDPSSAESSRNALAENGKKKAKDEKPPSKVVIRRLPPSMTKSVFVDQISPIAEHDYLYFVTGDPSAGSPMGFSRAYINFINQEDLFRFTETYDNYVFVDSKGQEFPAVVEFAPFQRIPKQRAKKKDPLANTIDSDPTYIEFKESLEAAAAEAAKPDATSKQHFFETDISSTTPQEATTTPLLEFLKQKKADRARIRDERREEKKRKEADRKMRQKVTKERKSEGDEELKDVKLLQPKERKEGNRDSRGSRGVRRNEKVKSPRENRPREFKNRNSKTSFNEENSKVDRPGGERRKEDKVRESTDGSKEGLADEGAGGGFERSKLSGSGRRRAGGGGGGGDRKPGVADGGEVGAEEAEKRKTRNEKHKSLRKERERKRREDFLAKKNLEKKMNSEGEKRKSKESEEVPIVEEIEKEGDGGETKERSWALEPDPEIGGDGEGDDVDRGDRRRRSLVDLRSHQETSDSERRRRSSLESGDGQCTRFRVGSGGGKSGGGGGRGRGRESSRGRSSRQPSREGDEELLGDRFGQDQDDGSQRDKDPRTGRRIRNKDRPSLQIYRPGMGKFSKQRLQKEKPLGSSTEVDSPSHSPSPVPKSKNTSQQPSP